jgi:hypothetical protein
MPVGAVKVIGQVGAALATFHPSRGEHEMINDQLAAILEKIGKRFLTGRSIENVFFLDLNPWQLPPMVAHLIAQPRQLLLSCQQVFSRNQPFSL